MKHFLITLVALCFFGSTGFAQSAKVFESKEALLEIMHARLAEKDILGAFDAMLPEGSVPASALTTMQNVVDVQLPPRLFNVDKIFDRSGLNGFHHEIYAYWTGSAYLYAMVTYHDRPDGVYVLGLNVHGQVGQLLKIF